MPSAVVVKEIRPERFKDTEFKKAILRAAEAYSKELLKDFEATTATWEHNVEFERIVDYEPRGPEVFVGTDDEIYGYVNNGTRPHPIFPVRAKVLRFQWGGKGCATRWNCWRGSDNWFRFGSGLLGVGWCERWGSYFLGLVDLMPGGLGRDYLFLF